MSSSDIVVIGAGIVGAACALALRDEGLSVTLVDAATPGSGVTAAGMGHLVALDESEDELDLCLMSLGLWRDFLARNPGVGDAVDCGTLWVAENEHQMIEAEQRAARLSARGWNAEVVRGDQLRTLEPELRRGLCGGVRVGGDSVVYPPAVAQHLALELKARGGMLRLGARVATVDEGAVVMADGSRLTADRIVVAAGAAVASLLPDVPVFGRKGHLAITDRYPGRLSHQVVSMNYGQTEAGSGALAVAANIQPRASGQWLVGSCRQDGQADTSLDPVALAAVLRTAIGLFPCLAQMNVIRAWAGMRPASPDGRPIIGAHPFRPGVWIAAGHEGLGVTTAFATARLLADQMMGRGSAIDVAPYSPARFAGTRAQIKVEHDGQLAVRATSPRGSRERVMASPPRGNDIVVYIDGHPVTVSPGATAIAAVATASIFQTRRSVNGERRFALCGMGQCQECRVTIDGRAHRLACQTVCRDGMRIETAAGEGA